MECSVCNVFTDPKIVSRFDAEFQGGLVHNSWHLYPCSICADRIRGAINNVLADQATTNAYNAAAEEMFPGC